jgi:hypothetical protein
MSSSVADYEGVRGPKMCRVHSGHYPTRYLDLLNQPTQRFDYKLGRLFNKRDRTTVYGESTKCALTRMCSIPFVDVPFPDKIKSILLRFPTLVVSGSTALSLIEHVIKQVPMPDKSDFDLYGTVDRHEAHAVLLEHGFLINGKTAKLEHEDGTLCPKYSGWVIQYALGETANPYNEAGENHHVMKLLDKTEPQQAVAPQYIRVDPEVFTMTRELGGRIIEVEKDYMPRFYPTELIQKPMSIDMIYTNHTSLVNQFDDPFDFVNVEFDFPGLKNMWRIEGDQFVGYSWCPNDAMARIIRWAPHPNMTINNRKLHSTINRMWKYLDRNFTVLFETLRVSEHFRLNSKNVDFDMLMETEITDREIAAYQTVVANLDELDIFSYLYVYRCIVLGLLGYWRAFPDAALPYIRRLQTLTGIDLLAVHTARAHNANTHARMVRLGYDVPDIVKANDDSDSDSDSDSIPVLGESMRYRVWKRSAKDYRNCVDYFRAFKDGIEYADLTKIPVYVPLAVRLGFVC